MRKDILRNNHLLLIVIQPYSSPIVWSSQVEEELLEQEFLERCFQEMLEEEDQDWFIPARDLAPGVGQIQQQLNGLSVSNGNADELAVSPVRMFVRQSVSQTVSTRAACLSIVDQNVTIFIGPVSQIKLNPGLKSMFNGDSLFSPGQGFIFCPLELT
jgi:hypothetical protein